MSVCWYDLPVEIKTHIFSFLLPQEQEKISLLNREAKDIYDQAAFWNEFRASKKRKINITPRQQAKEEMRRYFSVLKNRLGWRPPQRALALDMAKNLANNWLRTQSELSRLLSVMMHGDESSIMHMIQDIPSNNQELIQNLYAKAVMMDKKKAGSPKVLNLLIQKGAKPEKDTEFYRELNQDPMTLTPKTKAWLERERQKVMQKVDLGAPFVYANAPWLKAKRLFEQGLPALYLCSREIFNFFKDLVLHDQYLSCALGFEAPLEKIQEILETGIAVGQEHLMIALHNKMPCEVIALLLKKGAQVTNDIYKIAIASGAGIEIFRLLKQYGQKPSDDVIVFCNMIPRSSSIDSYLQETIASPKVVKSR